MKHHPRPGGTVFNAFATGLLGVASASIFVAQMALAQDVSLFRPSEEAGFGDAGPALRLLLSSAPKGSNHFCIIGYREAGGPVAWLHWREAGRLILWRGAVPGGGEDDSLLHSNRNLDLSQDMVETDADIAGSTYRVTRRWVDRRLADCAANGDHYTLTGP